MRVLVLPEVREYLKKLSYILYEKDYFSYLDSSVKYIEELFKEIETTLPNRQKRPAPPYFDRYGKNMYYVTTRKNRFTQWYVFFTIYQEKSGDIIFFGTIYQQ